MQINARQKIRRRRLNEIYTQVKHCVYAMQSILSQTNYSIRNKNKMKWCACDLSFFGVSPFGKIHTRACTMYTHTHTQHTRSQTNTHEHRNTGAISNWKVLRVLKQRPNFSESENYFNLITTTAQMARERKNDTIAKLENNIGLIQMDCKKNDG